MIIVENLFQYMYTFLMYLWDNDASEIHQDSSDKLFFQVTDNT